MIHTEETIERIRTLLVNSGVPKGALQEEMIDHYLSDLEAQINQNISPPLALQTTFKKIEKTDFSQLQSKKKFHLPLILAVIFLCVISYFIYQNPKSSADLTIVANSQAIAPDGWPLTASSTEVTSNFGMRIHPILKSRMQHRGIDIRAKIGTPVLATGVAIVKETGYTQKTGNYIILEHNDRFSSKYYHLSAIHVQQNDLVTKGSIIGEVGNTGKSLAPHLHYEIIDGKAPIDPLKFASP